MLQDFTDDRERLLSILETMIVGEGRASRRQPRCQHRRYGRGLRPGRQRVQHLQHRPPAGRAADRGQNAGPLSEKKSLIYFASGLSLNGVDNQAQLHATINAAIRAGVSFWPIDARGLVAQAPLGDATQGSPGGNGMYNGRFRAGVPTNFQQSQDTLYALAADTGGKALLDNNDLTLGIVQAQKADRSYYILGYYTTNTTLDGKFRRIRIALNNGLAGEARLSPGIFRRQDSSTNSPLPKRSASWKMR